MPPECAYIWRWFRELHSGRTVNGMGPSRASHLDVLAWRMNSGSQPLPWEIEALMALGATWVSVQSERPEGNVTPPPPKAPRIRHAGQVRQ